MEYIATMNMKMIKKHTINLRNITMDATNMKFIDNVFKTVTALFSMM
ncbi:hypothetical protein LCGC14_0502250 [marine sediment metagenome]|uniref:Uncharacterized protein n=1 Tax=marine sediment metagenome TaxID=412755 RepID=A0A0F9S3J6_9ZZZZ